MTVKRSFLTLITFIIALNLMASNGELRLYERSPDVSADDCSPQVHSILPDQERVCRFHACTVYDIKSSSLKEGTSDAEQLALFCGTTDSSATGKDVLDVILDMNCFLVGRDSPMNADYIFGIATKYDVEAQKLNEFSVQPKHKNAPAYSPIDISNFRSMNQQVSISMLLPEKFIDYGPNASNLYLQLQPVLLYETMVQTKSKDIGHLPYIFRVSVKANDKGSAQIVVEQIDRYGGQPTVDMVSEEFFDWKTQVHDPSKESMLTLNFNINDVNAPQDLLEFIYNPKIVVEAYRFQSAGGKGPMLSKLSSSVNFSNTDKTNMIAELKGQHLVINRKSESSLLLFIYNHGKPLKSIHLKVISNESLTDKAVNLDFNIIADKVNAKELVASTQVLRKGFTVSPYKLLESSGVDLIDKRLQDLKNALVKDSDPESNQIRGFSGAQFFMYHQLKWFLGVPNLVLIEASMSFSFTLLSMSGTKSH